MPFRADGAHAGSSSRPSSAIGSHAPIIGTPGGGLPTGGLPWERGKVSAALLRPTTASANRSTSVVAARPATAYAARVGGAVGGAAGESPARPRIASSAKREKRQTSARNGDAAKTVCG